MKIVIIENPEQLATELRLNATYQNGQMTCRFEVPILRSEDTTNPPSSYMIYYPLDRDFHLLYAQGRVTSPCSY